MGKIFAVISDDVEQKFRQKAFEKLGGKKGHFSEAIEQALEKWTGDGKDAVVAAEGRGGKKEK